MPGCAACGIVAVSVGKRAWGVHLCLDCAEDWPAPLGWSPLENGSPRWGLWPYEGTVRRLVVQAKDMPHGPQAWALRRAGMCAWQRLRDSSSLGEWSGCTESEDPDQAVWCPTPPSRKRRWADWYLPQFVGPGLAKVDSARFCALLRRRSQRLDQADLSGAQRRANLQGMFQGRRRRRPWPRAVCLFDDVSTTGATFLEASRALQEVGVAKVRCVCLAVVV